MNHHAKFNVYHIYNVREIATLKLLPHTDSRPNTDHYRLTFFMWVKRTVTFSSSECELTAHLLVLFLLLKPPPVKWSRLQNLRVKASFKVFAKEGFTAGQTTLTTTKNRTIFHASQKVQINKTCARQKKTAIKSEWRCQTTNLTRTCLTPQTPDMLQTMQRRT